MVLYYNNQLSQALADLFPDIGFDKVLLRKNCMLQTTSWNYILILYLDAVAKRRSFFENYANTHGFYSHRPEDWYSHPRDSLLATKVGVFYLQQ